MTEESSTLFSTEICHSLHVFVSIVYFAVVTDSPAQMYA